jgi:apolipoprotein D and lipocalin family protein
MKQRERKTWSFGASGWFATYWRLLAVSLFAGLSGGILLGCTGMPEGVEPVTGFDAERYLGKWHEVARLDHSFERDLIEVTAEYSRRDDGGIRVLNSGTDRFSGERKQAEGKAYFVGDSVVGHLKVSFFGPFYGSYIVFELGDNYDYAFVAGFNTDYLWLLAREPSVNPTIKQRFIERATALGFKTEALIWLTE